MKALRCPNPNCTHTFSADDAQRSPAMKCPLCGQVFRFRPPKPTAAARGVLPVRRPESPPGPTRLDPPPGTWKTVQTTPMPVAPMPPPAPPATAPAMQPLPTPAAPPPPGVIAAVPIAPPRPAVPPVAKPGEKIVHVRGMRNSRSRHRLVKTLVIVLVLGMGAAAATPLIIWFEQSLRTGRPAFDPGPGGLVFQMRTTAGEERVLTLNLDKTVWTADRDLKAKLKCFAAFQRDNDWLAVAIQDFGTRAPRQGELVSGAIDRLLVLFPNLAINSDTLEPAKIGGLDALKTTFTGSEKNVTHWGEVYLVAHHGFAYWVFVAAKSGTVEAAQALFAELDANSAIAFTTERRGWTEQPPRKDTFTAQSGAYTMETPEKVWRSSDAKTADDKNGELFLAGMFRSLPGQSKEETVAKNATLLGVSLDRKADLDEAHKDALAYFEKLWREQNKDYSFVPIKDGSTLSSEEVQLGPLSNPVTGRVGQVRLKLGDEKVRYLQIAVFNDAQKTHAVQFECLLPHRDIWQREFQDVLKTVKLNPEK